MKFPRASWTTSGDYFWDTYPANLCLKEDVENGNTYRLKPSSFEKLGCSTKISPQNCFMAMYTKRRGLNGRNLI